MYHNTATDRFEFVPYDYDNTYGIDWVGIDWGQRNIYRWGNAGESRPLVTRILNVPEYRNAYSRHLADYLDSEFAYENQVPNIDRLKALITPAVEADSFRILDWDFSIGDFHVSFQAPVTPTYNHVPYGIKPYIQTRIATAWAQLKYVNLPPVILGVQHLPAWPEPGQSVRISASVSDDDRIASVKLYYRTPATDFLVVEMLDDGNHADGAADDGVYGIQMPAQETETIVYYYLTAQDSQTAFTSYPMAAPANALFYLTHPVSDSDVQIKLFLHKALVSTDIGVGLLGSFNDWSKIYPMQEVAEDFWEITLFLTPDNYIYKFVTFRNLDGTSGISAWLADPENPRQDGPPHFNSVLTVSDPMIYYLKPADQETLTTAQPVLSARFGQARASTIDPGSITLKIDQQIVANAGQFYDGQKLEFKYRMAQVLAPGRHQIFLSAKTSVGARAEQFSEFWVRRPLLFINEFMASNQRTIADNAGDYDDWIELFNGGDQPINLNGMYLTDDLSRSQRWQLPDTTMAAGGFLLIWADEDQEQGPLHANFKLSAGGEQVGLFASVADGNFCLDTLSYGQQKTDISWGRFPEASINWTFMAPTPGAANKPGTATGIDQVSGPRIWALHANFPNSFSRQTCIGFDLAEPALVSLRIFNLSGQLIKTLSAREFQAGSHTVYWQGDNEQGHPVPSGTYFYQIKAGKLKTTRKMILLR